MSKGSSAEATPARPVRIAHITDIHVQRAPRLAEMSPKRLLGTANLYLAGRRRHFSEAVQQELVHAVGALKPDILVCTGDLTAQATVPEFEAALELLRPLFEAQPTVVIPGNHDTYTQGAVRSGRMETYFRPWLGKGPWPRVHLVGKTVAFIALQTCTARALVSSGSIGTKQLRRLDDILRSGTLADRHVFVLLGHEHHGFRTELHAVDGPVPIFNPGASGYASLPDKGRRAHFTVLNILGRRLEVDRFAWDDELQTFIPEPGGPYTTGC